MIAHLKDLTDKILAHKLEGRDIFGSYPEIYRELQRLSPEQFEASKRCDFMLARAAFEHLVNPNKHEVITGSKVCDAARKLRPVLDHYLGDAPPAQLTTNNYTFNNGPVAGCAFGDGTTVKADQFLSHREGDHHMGDKIHIGGNAIGSAIGRRASVQANDIIAQVQQSGIDDDLKEKLAKAAEMIESLEISEDDKADATDNLSKLSEEMQKPTPEPSRVRRLWYGIKEIAPTVASLLASAVSIAKLVSGTP
jgi:hypothetical protein